MRGHSACTADSYNVDTLAKDLRDLGMDPKFYDHVIHLEMTEDDQFGHVYIFGYGCCVFWNCNNDQIDTLLDLCQKHAVRPLPNPVTDEHNYHFGQETEVLEESDEIIIESDEPLIMLSLSFGMSQSVKLSSFEEAINRTIQKTKHLPEELANQGSTSLSRRKLSKYIGSLFGQRHSINLHNELLEIPEFFWRRPRYEPYYHMARHYLDISTRMNILNQRLAVLHELYEILSDELKHLHSSRLEWIIIYLIVIEVIFVILKDLLKIL